MLRRLTLLVAWLLLAAAARAYIVYHDSNGYVVKWQISSVPLKVVVPASGVQADGNTLSGSVVAAAQAWNAQMGTVQFAPTVSEGASHALDNGVNEVAMDDTADGEPFGDGVLAVTYSAKDGDALREADVIFNRHYTWGSYRGALIAGTYDLQRVALHELGHVLGLDHADADGGYVNAIMNSWISSLDQLQDDDIYGVQSLYGKPGVRPANDNFANASTLRSDADGDIVRGNSIGATREAGEPMHNGLSVGHSLWWKWTAPSDGKLKLTTTGSAFDAVTAVYTGISVAGLTQVSLQDDIGPKVYGLEGPPVPANWQSVKVTKDTVYYIAVDGRGVPDGASAYSGAMILNVLIDAPLAITTQPVDQVTTVGSFAQFVCKAFGRPVPSFVWERSTDGGQTWSALPGSIELYPDLNGNLVVRPLSTALNGTQFHCVVSNGTATLISQAATLTVKAVGPAFLTQPQDFLGEAGFTARFSAAATGQPQPTLRWQRLAAGSSVWVDLSDGGTYSGTTTYELTVTGLIMAMDGDQYRCVATNEGGTVNTSAAALHLTESWGVVGVSISDTHRLWVRADGSLWAMGDNSVGELGDGTTQLRRDPVRVATGVVAASAGSRYSLFLKEDGTLWGMGADDYGQLGDGVLNGTAQTSPVQIATQVVAMQAASGRTLFIKADGTLWSTGSNPFYPNLSTPPDVQLKQIAEGVNTFSAATAVAFVKYDGTLWAGGPRQSNVIGDGQPPTGYTNGPVQIADNVRAVQVGYTSMVFIRTDGSLWGNGTNSYGELGAALGAVPTPRMLATGVQTAAGGGMFYVLDSGGLMAVGYNQEGQLGDGTTTNRATPIQVATDVTNVATGVDVTLFTKRDGSLWGMGNLEPSNWAPITGQPPSSVLPPPSWALTPTLIRSGKLPVPMAPAWVSASKGTDSRYTLLTWKPQAAAANYQVWRSLTNDSTTATLVADNLVMPLYYDTSAPDEGTNYYYWVKATNSAGVSDFSPADYGFRRPKVPPTITQQPAAATALAGARVTFAVVATGEPAPTYQWQRQAAGGSGWQDLAEGMPYTGTNTAVLTVDPLADAMASDQFRCVVSNVRGSVISAVATLAITPPQGAVDVIGSPTGGNGAYYILRDGSVWSRDVTYNFPTGGAGSPYYISDGAVAAAYGKLLKADLTVWSVDSAVLENTAQGVMLLNQVAAGTIGVSSNGSSHFVLRRDGSLWAWGVNTAGQLGDASATNQAEPVKVADNVASMVMGAGIGYYIRSDGTLWRTGFAQIGASNVGVPAVPTLMASGVATVSANDQVTAFVKKDGSLWIMGRYIRQDASSYGNRPSPVQIDTNVVSVNCGSTHTLFQKTDDSWWGVGSNLSNQLNQGTSLKATETPVMVFASGVAKTAPVYEKTLYIKTNGALWSLGGGEQQLLTGAVAAPIAPAAPTAVAVVSAACVRLNWQPVIGASSYEIWRSNTNDSATAIRVATNLPWALGYDYPPVSGAWFYWIKAVNSAGKSALSEVVSLTYTYIPPPMVPTFGGSPMVSPAAPGSTGPITITTAVSGNPVPTLQWQVSYSNGYSWTNLQNDSDYANVTTATLSILRPSVAMTGWQYRLLASNTQAVNQASGVATLTALPHLYRGSYRGNIAAGGSWMLYVRDNGTATLLASLTSRKSVIVLKGLSIGADGGFSAAGTEVKASDGSPVATALSLDAPEAPQGRTAAATGDFSLTGQIAADGTVTGQLGGFGLSFSGFAVPIANDSRAYEGYYSAAALDSASGTLDVIVSSGGSLMAVRKSATFAEGKDGALGPDGVIGFADWSDHATLELNIDAAAGTLGGTLTPENSAAPITYIGLADTVASTARVVNLSVRTPAGTGSQTVIIGFVISGSGTKSLLLRGIGPALGLKGVSNPLADPSMRLLDATGAEVAANNDWGGGSTLSQQFAAVGAFPLPADSKDAAIYRTLPPGVYSYHTFPADTGNGVVLGEAYDTDDDTSTAAVVNMSARTQVGTGENILIAGFVITGNAPKTLLIRGLGPTLTSKGVTGALADPQLYLFGPSGVITSNDNWGGTNALKNAFATVGADDLESDNSKDAALLVTLAPGVYSAQVSGVNNTTGVGLVEIYLMP